MSIVREKTVARPINQYVIAESREGPKQDPVFP